MSWKLDNYLRMYRKRAGLSQADVAFLLGARSGSHLSRYEQFRRLPTLKTALALEFILGAQAGDLFAGMHEEIVKLIAERAAALMARMDARKRKPATVAKLATLAAIRRRRR